jgi:hypothetical protein
MQHHSPRSRVTRRRADARQGELNTLPKLVEANSALPKRRCRSSRHRTTAL